MMNRIGEAFEEWSTELSGIFDSAISLSSDIKRFERISLQGLNEFRSAINRLGPALDLWFASDHPDFDIALKEANIESVDALFLTKRLADRGQVGCLNHDLAWMFAHELFQLCRDMPTEGELALKNSVFRAKQFIAETSDICLRIPIVLERERTLTLRWIQQQEAKFVQFHSDTLAPPKKRNRRISEKAVRIAKFALIWKRKGLNYTEIATKWNSLYPNEAMSPSGINKAVYRYNARTDKDT